ncbi:MAG: sugar ABC transporter substrate-binding protein [Mesorhizobium sp.]|uniref:substrate-binding domain-containing protein n=1 Tax=unclassified Mesorhizobium TaxID=325217 RepID=UPI000FC9C598|nr:MULTISPECIES: substrate-binding domain-containing protein [unclassified Mesorhizobium]TGV92130.1 sugar ABC transporter substrate-binding protein [Mesorhizobium sp. M00.F.Ca.ET.158.01.1.1]RUV15616.1 sugar ABC transporter substrate-binding protein [Mesorhizobium sp. M1A.F.Ca.IN.022.04.1.1]RWG26724.1 MAG: sugar ABC transporter substrate-binding protein [Mesorhizobium sp.]TGQ23220.1 sugar ABC transporter substrate-binding protein [Mesorhizobium sp. M00.F.Ca.ET.217.01.1.1]TIN16753.1 MAG: sugar A
MKKLLISTALAALMATAFAAVSTGAFAAKLGVSIVNFDNNFQTLLMHGMQARAKEKGAEIQVEDAQNDVAKQLDQVKNFIASGVDAIIVTLVDTNASKTISEEAAKAGIPLVFVNLEPSDMKNLPEKQVYVGSNEVESGTLEAFEVCKMLRAKGKSAGATAYIIMGSLVHQAALQRTKDVEQIFSTDMCNFIKVTDKQSSEWSRDNAQNLMTNWLTAGPAPDAVIANNDESAIGAILALKANGVDLKNVVVGGIDATQDGLQAMKAGELSVTVFQNAKGQGGGGVDAALALAKGEKVDRVVYVPFELVTPANAAEYLNKN